MSLLSTELSQLIYRIPIVAPQKKQLYELSEKLLFELTTDLALGKKTDLKIAAPRKGPLLTWASFTLGLRSQFSVRVHLMGFALEHEVPTLEALELSEGLLFYAPRDEPRIENFLKLRLEPDVQSRPCTVLGLSEEDPAEGPDLRVRALREWLSRNFDKTKHLSPKSPHLLEAVLEWVLSF